MTKLRIFLIVLFSLGVVSFPFMKLQRVWAKQNPAILSQGRLDVLPSSVALMTKINIPQAQNTVLQSDAIQAAIDLLLEEDEEVITIFLPLVGK